MSSLLLVKIIARTVVNVREKKEINIQVGEHIKAVRERAKITQEVLAERIEVSAQYISDLERGVVGVSIATLKRLCVALGVSSDMILFGIYASNNLSALSEKCDCLTKEQFAILCEIIDKYIEAVNTIKKD